MPLDKVVYSRTFHLGDHNFEKIGTEGSVGEGETKEQLRSEAVKFIYDSFAELHPELNVVLPPAIKKGEFNLDEGKIVVWDFNEMKKPVSIAEQIKSVTDIKVLETYKFIVKGKPELEEVYSNKLAELGNA